MLVSHPTVSRLLSSPNIQSGKYNEMDPILIGTAVSEHVIKEMSTCCTIGQSAVTNDYLTNIHVYVMINN